MDHRGIINSKYCESTYHLLGHGYLMPLISRQRKRPSMFFSGVVGIFQITFHIKIHVNNIFLIFLKLFLISISKTYKPY